MKSLITILFSFIFIVGALCQTRNVIVNTNGVIVQPTNFWSVDATNARNGLGLGSASTNPESAFQPSSTVLSNLASSNAVNITNLRATNIVGTVALASNISGVLAISNGGTGATNSANSRTNLGLPWSGLTNDSSFGFVSALGLSSTDNVVFSTVGASTLTIGSGKINYGGISPNALRFYDGTNLVMSLAGTNITGNRFVGSVFNGGVVVDYGNSITFGTGGVGIVFNQASAADTTRTNLGLGWSALTNSNSATALLSYIASNNIIVGVTNTNSIIFSNAITATKFNGTVLAGSFGSAGFLNMNAVDGSAGSINTSDGGGDGNGGSINTSGNSGGGWGGSINTSGGVDNNGGSLNLSDGGGSINTRGTGTLELGTNGARTTITGTASDNRYISFPNTNGILVAVNSNGTVVSPTNFWQNAPIGTVVQNFTPVVNATNAATNARTIYVYSLAISTTGVTNVITLPTNSSTYNGDNVTVIHEGPTSSVTSVKQLGASTNLVDINTTDSAVKFIYENNAWRFYHNISFTESIKFVDGNTESNKATSRTNLGLGWTALTNTNNASFQRVLFVTNTTPASAANLSDVKAWLEISVVTNNVTNSFRIPTFQ